MRFVYLDEAGTSAREPVAVVAGVIIRPDEQWKALELHIESLINRYIPETKRREFVFHATELFSGGKAFPRSEWPRALRWQILEEVLSIPMYFELPVVLGYSRKFIAPGMSDNLTHHAMAYTLCAIATNAFMKIHSETGEVAMFVAEDN